jgi:hypothetical protein
MFVNNIAWKNLRGTNALAYFATPLGTELTKVLKHWLQIEGLTDEYTSLEFLSMINVGLTRLVNIIFKLYSDAPIW